MLEYIVENQNTEWKQEWNESCLKTICAFANTQGGILEIGKSDSGEVIGLKGTMKLLVDIPNIIKNLLGIIVEVDSIQIENKSIIQVKVPKYSNPISYHGKFYFRSGSTTQELGGATLSDFLTGLHEKKWDGITEPRVKFSDLDGRALKVFRKKAIESSRLTKDDAGDNVSDEQLLNHLNLIKDDKLTNAAVLLFAEEPRKFIFGSYVKIGMFRKNEEILYHDEVSGLLMLAADEIVDKIYSKYFKGLISFQGIQRIETYPVAREALREALREAVMNAIIHNDYTSQNPIQIKIYENKIYIFNEGQLPKDWTVETLYSVHKSVQRNPLLANTFFRSAHVESWGRGIQRINERRATLMVRRGLNLGYWVLILGLLLNFVINTKNWKKE
jgi:ATP-dependent DNA helicase RecG